ncbi:hypothetical protein RIF29_06505 [Crotalaria pallida]|uniref:HMA domain-containing protein n=1 Tax=Crotalaria pallida TaxID=3830 RepID=A0AAN9PAX8_CROPI
MLLPYIKLSIFLQQKIVIKIQLDCDKCRSKALKIAAQEKGVSSVALEGEEKDKLVVTGEVDAVCLASVLRKKFRSVTLGRDRALDIMIKEPSYLPTVLDLVDTDSALLSAYIVEAYSIRFI